MLGGATQTNITTINTSYITFSYSLSAGIMYNISSKVALGFHLAYTGTTANYPGDKFTISFITPPRFPNPSHPYLRCK